MLASDPCTRHLDMYKGKMTGQNCPNYTIKEEMHRQLCKIWNKKTGSCLILAKTVRLTFNMLKSWSLLCQLKNEKPEYNQDR